MKSYFKTILALTLLLCVPIVGFSQGSVPTSSSSSAITNVDNDGVTYVDLSLAFDGHAGTFSDDNGVTGDNRLYSTWASNSITPQVVITSRDANLKIVHNLRNKDGMLELTTGTTEKSYYEIALPKGYILKKLDLNAKAFGIDNLTLSYGTEGEAGYVEKTFNTDEFQNFHVETDGTSNYIVLTMVGSNKTDGSLNISAKAMVAQATPDIELLYHLKKHISGNEITSKASATFEQGTTGISLQQYHPMVMQTGFVNFEYYDNPDFTGSPITTVDATATQEMRDNARYVKDIYVKYTVGDLPAGFVYTSTERQKPQEGDDVKWMLFKGNASGNGSSPVYVNGSDFSTKSSTPVYGDEDLDDYFFAFYGDPFETTIINKAKGLDTYLAGNGTVSSGLDVKWTSDWSDTPFITNTDLYGTVTYTGIEKTITTWSMFNNASLANDFTFKLNNTNQNLFQMVSGGKLMQGNSTRIDNSQLGTIANNGWPMSLWVDTPKAAVRYDIYNVNGGLDYSYTDIVEPGTAFSLAEKAKRGFCTYTVPEGIAEDKLNVVNVSYVYNGPVTFSTPEEPQYNYIIFPNVNSTSTNSYASSAQELLADQPTTRVNSENLRWAFFGNPYSLKMVNEAKGVGEYVCVPSNGSGTELSYSSTEEKNTWELFRCDADDKFALRLKGASTMTFINCLTRTTNSSKFDYHVGDQTVENGNITNYTAAMSLRNFVEYSVLNGDGEEVEHSPLTLAVIGAEPDLPKAQRRGYCVYAYDTEKITAETELITATYKVEGAPFEFSKSESDLHYYMMKIQTGELASNNNNGFSWTFFTDASGTYYARMNVASGNGTKDALHCWAFIGDPYRLKVYNMTANKNDGTHFLTLDASVDLYPRVKDGENKYWTLFQRGGDFTLRLANVDATDFTSTGYYTSCPNYGAVKKVDAEAFSTANYSNQGNRLQVFDVYSVTYVITRVDGTVDTKSGINAAGQPNLPANLRNNFAAYTYFVDANHDNSWPTSKNIDANTGTVYVQEAIHYPFEFSTYDSETKTRNNWYYWSVRPTNVNAKYISAEGPGPYPAKTNINDYNPMALWAFEKNENGTFSIYNKWYGEGYLLTNPYTTNANSNTKQGPVMMKKDKDASTEWTLVYYDETRFGFTSNSVDGVKMNINVYGPTDGLCFYKDDATNALNSRMIVEPYLEKASAEDTKIAAKEAILKTWNLVAAPAVVGNVFCLAETVKDDAGKTYTTADINTNDLSAALLEQIVTNPANYVQPLAGYYRIKNKSAKNYMQVMASGIKHNSVGSKINEVPVMTDGNDALSIFHLASATDKETGSKNITTIQSQGMKLNYVDAKKAVTSTSDGEAYNMSIFPMGNGTCIINTHKAATDDPSNHAMLVNSSSLKVGAYYDYRNHKDVATAQWYLEPVTSSSVKLNALGDNAYASLCVPYDVTLPEGVKAYKGETAEEGTTSYTLKLTEVSGTVPGGTPVMLIGSAATAGTQTIEIADQEKYAASPLNTGVLQGTYVSIDIREAADDFEQYYVLGKGNISGGVGFFNFAMTGKQHATGANKAFVYGDYSIQQARAKAFGLFFDDDDNATAIETATRVVVSDDRIFDLSGRQVSKPLAPGIYIQNGKKFVVKRK